MSNKPFELQIVPFIYFQFTIKPVDKKAPDFTFFAPKLKINKLVSTVTGFFAQKMVHLSLGRDDLPYVARDHWDSCKLCQCMPQ